MIEIEIETGLTTVMIVLAAPELAVEAEVQSASVIVIENEFESEILWKGRGIGSVTIETSIADENRSSFGGEVRGLDKWFSKVLTGSYRLHEYGFHDMARIACL
jgi:hypothetical protein